MRATLILANGAVFQGESIGSTEDRICEMVFNTSMAGYQELLTDPSYAGQGVVMTYPLIGNYGVNSEDNESSRPWAEAFVVRRLSPRGSNFRCEGDLGSYLKEHNITGIQGVDTRALTKILRSQGSMNGMLTCAEHFNIAQVLEELKALKQQNAQRDADEAVTLALKAGKITPAQKDWALSYALADPKGFGAFVEKAPQVVPMGEIDLGGGVALKSAAPDEATTLVCKQLGVSQEDLEKYGKEE